MQITRKLVSFLGLFLIGIFSSKAAFCQNYGYVNPLDKRHTLSIQISPAFFSGGDRAVDAIFCSKNDLFICVTSAEFSFAVPAAKKINVHEWEYKGNKYNLIRQEKIELLGRIFDLWIIESVQVNKKIRYAYSWHHGLIAISVEMGEESYTFLSQREFGFGHQHTK